MEFLAEYGLFLAKTLTIVISIIAIIIVVVSAGMKQQAGERGHLEVSKLNDKFDELADSVKAMIIDEETVKKEEKARKKKEKEEKKQLKKAAKKASKEGDKSENAEGFPHDDKKRVFVTDFDGDIKASATEDLREVITAILSVADEKDEVVIRLESQGGMVHSYGLAASQLRRITQANIPLTVCVDKVAASGGYMMACVANKIISAPFGIIGSIGVVAQLPNFHRLLKKHDVDYEMFTAGEYKRTITMFGENTEKGKQKFIEDLEDTHVLFKDFIKENREVVDVEDVATGEIWFGTRALDKNLVDEIATSDSYLFEKRNDANIYEIKYVHKKSMAEKLGISVEASLESVITRWMGRLNNKIFS